MSDELIKWECPNCGNVDEDIDLQETHCSGCGLVVFVSDGDAVSREWFIDPRPTPRELDGLTCPHCGSELLENYACPRSCPREPARQ